MVIGSKMVINSRMVIDSGEDRMINISDIKIPKYKTKFWHQRLNDYRAMEHEGYKIKIDGFGTFYICRGIARYHLSNNQYGERLQNITFSRKWWFTVEKHTGQYLGNGLEFNNKTICGSTIHFTIKGLIDFLNYLGIDTYRNDIALATIRYNIILCKKIPRGKNFKIISK